MLAKFAVKNFKNFRSEFVLDLSDTRNFEFNEFCVQSGLVKHGIIYGPNGVGKSNLAFAIFDIIGHLTDKNKRPQEYENYLNAESEGLVADFCYEFKFGCDRVRYKYSKKSYEEIFSEELFINDDLIVRSFPGDYSQPVFIKIYGAENLKSDLDFSEISILRYIKNNTILPSDKRNELIGKFFSFVDGMLHFRTLEDRFFQGYKLGAGSVNDYIIEQGKVDDFSAFLRKAEVDCSLTIVNVNDKKRLAFKFKDKTIDFWGNASTGTRALGLFYYWSLMMRDNEKSPKFIFIDEFDAFYHNSASELIVREINSLDFQSILTTHNTNLLSNEISRPDCFFNMSKENVRSFSSLTNKEMRKAHNIEKMYKSGEFDCEK